MPGMRGVWQVPFVRYVNLEMMGTAKRQEQRVKPRVSKR
jgi:hypothetical protein